MIAPIGRSAREQAAYERIVWPGTDTLRNRLGLRDPVLLDRAEREVVKNRLEEGFPSQANPYSYAGFKEDHRHMFQDVYDWAG